jgi:uncharacterized protein (UPF0332 family)
MPRSGFGWKDSDTVQPGTVKLLAKAERASQVAAAALEGGAPNVAAGRAFYAILYAAKAALNERGIRLQAHVRIAAAVDEPVREYLSAAIVRRRSGEAEVTYDEAAAMVERAQACVTVVRSRLP